MAYLQVEVLLSRAGRNRYGDVMGGEMSNESVRNIEAVSSDARYISIEY